MKSKFILELDMTASIEANLQFLDNCEKEIKLRRKNLKRLKKRKPSNQLDIETEASKIQNDK